MKNNFFLQFTAVFLAIVLLIYGLLVAFLYASTEKHVKDDLEKSLEESSLRLQNDIGTLVSLSEMNLKELLGSQLLMHTLIAEHQVSGMEFLVTDAKGTVLLSTMKEGWGKEFSPESVAFFLENGVGKNFDSDLEGLFDSPVLVQLLSLETEQGGADTRAGIVFIVQPQITQPYLQMILYIFLVVAILLFLILVLVYVFLSQKQLRAWKLLNEAAYSFAEGDFSKRIPEDQAEGLVPLLRAYNQMADRAEKNERIHQTFVSNVSHDLRTPLTTIGGFVQNILEGAVPPEKEKHYLKIILDEVHRLARLVQTLLEMSRMSAGERKYEMVPMDLCELGRITLLSFEERLESKHLEVSFDCEKENIFVLADRDAIQQVIYNLIDNAIKFTPERGNLSLRVRIQGRKALFAVKNSGEGIPEEEISHLFDRFYKSDRSRGLDKKGLGLGLSIVKSIVSAHKEEVWVESLPGAYTEFIFSLPITGAPAKKRGDYIKSDV